MKLHTKICSLLNIEYPIISAGMGIIARAELVAAVSEAGGLGLIGAFGISPEELLVDIKEVKRLTKKPFGVDVIFPDVPDEASQSISEETIRAVAGDKPLHPQVRTTLEYFSGGLDRQLEIVQAEEVPVLVSGLGNPESFMPAARAKGILVGSLIGTVEQARQLESAGVDFLIAQGYDAGGHTGKVGIMALLPQVVDAVKIPVLAAGGIGDGRGLVAALVLGASGVVMGTRFVATPECMGHRAYKEKIVQAGDTDTTITKAYSGKPLRTFKNRWTAKWSKKKDQILPFPLQALKAGDHTMGGWIHGELEYGAALAGQSSGLVTEIKPAGEIIRDIVTETDQLLRTGILSNENQSG